MWICSIIIPLRTINRLNNEKRKIQEKLIKYNYDFDLFNKFKNIKFKNENFEIPELFKNKYKLFLELESKNTLDFDTFDSLYVEEQINTSYNDLFNSNEGFNYKVSSINYNEELEEDFINETDENIKKAAQYDL